LVEQIPQRVGEKPRVLGFATAAVAALSFTFVSPAVAANDPTKPIFRLWGGAAAPRPWRAPIRARRPHSRYTGPVYVLTANGRIVPFVSQRQLSQLSAAVGGAAAASVTLPGGPKPKLLVPGRIAQIVDGGLAAAPMEAPEAVKRMIWAANEIVGLPYIWGGGHASFHAPGYDCSGTVSYALHGGGWLHSPEDSSELMAYGKKGAGVWVTIFANPEHAYVDIAGLRLDTSPVEDPWDLESGPRWRPLRATNAGYVIRHPAGL
jgi:cell wall-associated NlpC family hydrolase